MKTVYNSSVKTLFSVGEYPQLKGAQKEQENSCLMAVSAGPTFLDFFVVVVVLSRVVPKYSTVRFGLNFKGSSAVAAHAGITNIVHSLILRDLVCWYLDDYVLFINFCTECHLLK